MKNPQSRPKRHKAGAPTRYPMTLKILTLCVMIEVVTSLFPTLLEPLSMRLVYPWGWITYQFTHVNWPHLIGNFMFGLPFMCFLESKVGSAKLLQSYLLCGIGSVIVFGLMESFNMGMIGASGSISGMAAMAALHFGDRKLDKCLGLLFCATMLSIQVIMAITDAGFSGVAFWGHVGGMLTGICLIWGNRWTQQLKRR